MRRDERWTKQALALAFILCSASFAVELHQDLEDYGRDSAVAPYREWSFPGIKSDAEISDPIRQKNFGGYYIFVSDNITRLDDSNPGSKVHNDADSDERIQYRSVPKLESPLHIVPEQPMLLATGHGRNHTVMELVFEITPKPGGPIYLSSCVSIPWRCTPREASRLKQHDSVRSVNAQADRR
jgi:hypothetical protein